MTDPELLTLSSTITEELLERYRAGDSVATQRLFFRLRRALLSEVRRDPSYPALRASYDDEDIVGELWKTIFARGLFDRFRSQGPGSLRAFIYRCLDYLIVDLVRRQTAGTRPVPTGSLEPLSDESQVTRHPESPGPGPSTIVSLDDWVATCRSKLDDAQGEIWRLRVTEGLDFAEIAARVGLADSTVRWHFMRCRERLAASGLLTAN